MAVVKPAVCQPVLEELQICLIQAHAPTNVWPLSLDVDVQKGTRKHGVMPCVRALPKLSPQDHDDCKDLTYWKLQHDNPLTKYLAVL